MGRYVGLQGYGENYVKDLRQNPTYSRLTIILGEFPDDSTKLSSSIKGRTHIFVFEWPQFIYQNKYGVRYIFDKSLNAIEEETHKIAVQKRIESKQYLKMGLRSNPRDEKVQVPARRSREEIRQEVDLERRKEEMKKEEKMKAESEAFYLKLSIQA